ISHFPLVFRRLPSGPAAWVAARTLRGNGIVPRAATWALKEFCSRSSSYCASRQPEAVSEPPLGGSGVGAQYGHLGRYICPGESRVARHFAVAFSGPAVFT